MNFRKWQKPKIGYVLTFVIYAIYSCNSDSNFVFLAKFDAQEFYNFLSFRAKFETKMTMSLYCIDFGDLPEVKIVPNYRRVIIFCDKKKQKTSLPTSRNVFCRSSSLSRMSSDDTGSGSISFGTSGGVSQSRPPPSVLLGLAYNFNTGRLIVEIHRAANLRISGSAAPGYKIWHHIRFWEKGPTRRERLKSALYLRLK